jgi:hypothetical protein
MRTKELFLMEREYLFNYSSCINEEEDLDEGYTIMYKEDFSGAGQNYSLEIMDCNGEFINDPFLVLEITEKIKNHIYKPQNTNN